MSKSHALWWAIFWMIVAVCLAVIGLGLIAWAAIMWAAVLISIFGYKAWRDGRLVTNASKAVEPTEQVIQMTSPGSHRLFVPDPLDRSR